jgi:hypothetical protein
MDVDLDDLDTSWIEKEEKRFSIESNYEKTKMESILCYFVYIDHHHSIQKVIKQEEVLVSLSSDNVGMTNTKILQIIQNRRILDNGMKYKFMHLLQFNIDLDHDKIEDFAYGENDLNLDFFKEVSIFNDVVIQPSIFIFHPLHSLYFFFKEDVMKIKSILSKPLVSSNVGNSKSSKKVNIYVHPSSKKSVQTRKHFT